MTKSTPHAHTKYVDGINTPFEMVEAAISKGFVSLGFSEHGRQDFDLQYCLDAAEEKRYIEEITQLKAQYAGRIAVHLGVERDEYGLARREQFDYVIGSKHYFKGGHDFFAGDGELKSVYQGCARFFDGDFYRMTRAYYEQFADYIVATRPDIIGHFDLVTKHNEDGKLFDESDARYRAAGFAALERMAQTDALLEVNTGAIARGYRTVPYPSRDFLLFWRALGGRVILGSDCHDATRIDMGYQDAEALCRAVGYKSAFRLGTHTLFEEYAL